MKIKNTEYLSLGLWVSGLLVISSVLGTLTRSNIDSWYTTLNRSVLTPPSYVFPIAWTLLYIMIAFSGWTLWRTQSFAKLILIKRLYIMQLLLNWSWSPLFFYYHLTGISLVSLVAMDVSVALIVYFSYAKIRSVSMLMLPYLGWILFATYLNFYIWQYN